MARGLFEIGHTVHVITRGEREQVSFYDGAYVHKITHRTDRYVRYSRLPNLLHALNYSHAVHDKVKRLILNDGVQIVDSPIWQFEGLVTAVSRIAPVVVRLVTARRQIAALQRDRGDDVRLLVDMEQMLLERADHLIPNTRATLDAVKKAYSTQLVKDRYTTVPYGIVPAADEEIRPFDSECTDSALTILYVGRLERRKGILDLFEAIPLVLRKVPGVKFVIAVFTIIVVAGTPLLTFTVIFSCCDSPAGRELKNQLLFAGLSGVMLEARYVISSSNVSFTQIFEAGAEPVLVRMSV